MSRNKSSRSSFGSHRHRNPRTALPLSLEVLEDRTLPSIDFTNFSVPATTPSSGLLTLNGRISDSSLPSSISVTINWGDKVSTTVSASATAMPGIFTFSASHTYANPPSSKSPVFTVTASARDSTHASKGATDAAVVADGLHGDEAVHVAPGKAGSVQVTIGSFTGSFSPPAYGGPIVVFGGPSASAPDSITVNEAVALPVTVYGGSQDTLTVQDPIHADTITMTNNSVTANGGTVTYSGLSSLLVSGLGGGDSVTMTGIAAGMATTVDGVSGNPSFAGQFGSAGFNGSLALDNFTTATFSDAGDFTGSLTVNSPGLLQQLSVAGTVTVGSSITVSEIAGVPGSGVIGNASIGTNVGSIFAGSISGMIVTNNATSASIKAAGQGTISNLSVGTNSGSISAVEDSTSGSGTISNSTISSNSGSVSAGSISGMSVTSNSGSITSAGQGTISNLSVGTNTGSISAVEDSTSGSGTISTSTVGTNSGSISSGSISGMSVTSNSGTITSAGQGTISNLSVGTNSGSISAVEDTSPGSGTISTSTIGTNSGSVSAGTISGMSVTSNSGSITAAGQGTITNLTVFGTNSGLIQAKADTTNGSGVLSNISIGTLTGKVSAATINNLNITTVAPTANLVAGHFNIVTAQHAAPTVHFIEPTVTRTLSVTSHNGGAVPDYGFYYDGTSADDPSGDPVVVVQVRTLAGSPPGSFDFGATTSTATFSPNGFDLAGLYSADTNGNRNVLTGIHNVVIGGNLLLGAVPTGAIGFFGLPNGTGGVQLPQDTVAVAVAGNLPAASIVAKAVPSLAAGSFAGVSAATANHTNALAPLAVGTALTQANDTFQVFLSAANDVAQFLVTGPGGSFDDKQMRFGDLLADNLPVTAADTLVPSGNSTTVVSRVVFTGQGGSLTTAQAITQSITNITPGGSLGDLILSDSGGLTANVTAPSIIGNIDIANGGIAGTIETSGDLGRTFTDSSGNITGVTSIQAGGGGLTGRIIVGGNLISQAQFQSDLDGVIAVQGDIGAIQTANGIAVTGANGALIRFGGITVSTGGVTGQIVAVGNVFGDLSFTGGLSGRIAVNGNEGEYGLAAGRDGILGNVSVSGGIDTTGAIVSAGQLGDAASGTQLSISGDDKGILAAVGNIHFGATGSLNQAGLFENVGTPGTPKYDDGQNLAVIDSIFGSLIIPGDVDQILFNLLHLIVGSDGNLTIS